MSGHGAGRSAFSSLLGISYYLTRDEFAAISCEGAAICLDDPMDVDGAESARNRDLAAAAGVGYCLAVKK